MLIFYSLTENIILHFATKPNHKNYVFFNVNFLMKVEYLNLKLINIEFKFAYYDQNFCIYSKPKKLALKQFFRPLD